MTKILDVKNISKSYQTVLGEVLAIKDVSFSVSKGEIVGIVGSSGCGKSTLLNIIAGLDSATDGEVLRDASFAYMLQTDALLPYLSVLDNALLGLKIKKMLTDENILYTKKLLESFGLGEFLDKYPANLSGGMRQRVALVRTLALKPDLILLDEPLSALDYVTRLTITDQIWKILKELNVTTILISHDIAECVSFCDRIIVLSKRPAVIKREVEIPFANDTIPSNKRKRNDFNKYHDMIWGDLDKNIT